MTTHTVPPAWKWRRVVAVVVTVVAAAASMATGSGGSSTKAVPVSGRVTLSPTDPEVRIPFTVDRSVEADNGSLQVLIETGPIWVGVSGSPPVGGPEVTIETESSVIEPASNEYFHPQTRCGYDCEGSNELVIRWPAEVAGGSVIVDWAISAQAEFDDDESPEGSEVTLDVDAPPVKPEAFASWDGTVNWERPMVDAVFRISSDAPLHPGDVSLLRVGYRSGAGAVTQIRQSDEWVVLPAGQGLEIAVPESCATGSCSFDVPMVLEVASAYSRGSAALELVAPSIDGAVAAEVLESDVWSSPATAEHVISLDSAVLDVTVPVSLEASGDFGDAPSMFWVACSVELVEFGSRDPRVSVTPAGYEDDDSPWVVWAKPDDKTGRNVFAVAAECDDRGCLGEVDLDVVLHAKQGEVDPSALVRIVVDSEFLSSSSAADVGHFTVEIGSTP